MDKEQLIQRLFQVVAHKIRHKHYSHVVNKSKTYKQLVAGKNLDSLLKQYVRREDKNLFEQRVQLTQHIVTSISKNLLDIFYKVPRSNSARETLSVAKSNESDNQIQDIKNIAEKFWGDASYSDYLSTRWVELNAVEPNGFVVFEWDDFDPLTEAIAPRPFEVKCDAAIDFAYKNRDLQYLIVMQPYMYSRKAYTDSTPTSKVQNPKDGFEKGHKYTLYGKDQTFQLLQIDETRLAGPMDIVEGEIKQLILDGALRNFVKLGAEVYEYIEFDPHNCDRVPAFRVGYLRDLETDGETFTNPLHSVEPYLMKTIKVNSELDLVATLLAFPQQVRYGSECDADGCFSGELADGSTCGSCEGTGIKATAPSAQDAIILKKPDSREELLPIKDIIGYIQPDVDIVKWQEQYIENISLKCKRIMFNSDIFDRKQIADTASGKNLDMQNVYDTLHPFAVRYSKLWIFGMSLIAKLGDRDNNLVVGHTFGKDFKLKSLDTLIMDASIANSIGNPSLVEHINADIAQIIFAEKPIALMRYELKQLYNPFSGKSEKEIIILMATNFVSRKEKVLHANYGRVFDELEMEYAKSSKDFYKLKRSVQRNEIYRKVDEIIAQIDAETPPTELSLDD